MFHVSQNYMTNVIGFQQLIEALYNEYYIAEGMFQCIGIFWRFSTA